MTPGDNPYFDRRRHRDVEGRWKFPFGGRDSDQDPPETDSEEEQPVRDTEQRNPMVDDEMRFRETLLHHMQEISQRLTAVEVGQREPPRVFQVGEGSGMSHHVPVHDEIGRASCRERVSSPV